MCGKFNPDWNSANLTNIGYDLVALSSKANSLIHAVVDLDILYEAYKVQEHWAYQDTVQYALQSVSYIYDSEIISSHIPLYFVHYV